MIAPQASRINRRPAGDKTVTYWFITALSSLTGIGTAPCRPAILSKRTQEMHPQISLFLVKITLFLLQISLLLQITLLLKITFFLSKITLLSQIMFLLMYRL